MYRPHRLNVQFVLFVFFSLQGILVVGKSPKRDIKLGRGHSYPATPIALKVALNIYLSSSAPSRLPIFRIGLAWPNFKDPASSLLSSV